MYRPNFKYYFFDKEEPIPAYAYEKRIDVVSRKVDNSREAKVTWLNSVNKIHNFDEKDTVYVIQPTEA